MNTAPAEAARLRLQHLHTVFLHIRTPGQLTEAMAEAGSIYFDLMQLGLVPSSDHLQELGSIGQLNAGRVQTEDVANHAYQVLWQQAADMFSSRRRILLRPVPDATVPQWTLTRSTQAPGQAEPTVTHVKLPSTGTVHTTNWQQDYAEQGQRYALFVSEVLAELQRPQKPLTVDQLEPEVTRIVTGYGKERYLSADAIADLINESGKVTSGSQVKLTKAFNIYCESMGKKRNRTATLTNTDKVLDQMVDEKRQVSGTKGRRTKKPIRYNDDD
jgi:hypothetical protein